MNVPAPTNCPEVKIHFLNQVKRFFCFCFFFNFLRQEKEQELEQLTKELRQVNLQQFIQQTGTKVTVLPAQPATESNGVDTHTHTH